MIKISKINILFALILILSSCKSNTTKNSTSSDQKENKSSDKKMSNEVVIGTQTWMTKNLNVDRFQNGDIIPEAKTAEEWIAANEEKRPVWCYYENDSTNGAKYGKLYNWFAVNDYRGLAPKGWIVPSNDDFNNLITYLGGKYEESTAPKLKSSSGWLNNDENGNNESGFSALPGGYRYEDGTFDEIGINGAWWCRDETPDAVYHAFFWWFEQSYFGDIQGRGCLKTRGQYVRCIKFERK